MTIRVFSKTNKDDTTVPNVIEYDIGLIWVKITMAEGLTRYIKTDEVSEVQVEQE